MHSSWVGLDDAVARADAHPKAHAGFRGPDGDGAQSGAKRSTASVIRPSMPAACKRRASVARLTV